MGDISVTVRLDADLAMDLDFLTDWFNASREEIVVEALRRWIADKKARADAFIQEGIDSADRGELISQDDMEAWFAARHHRTAAE